MRSLWIGSGNADDDTLGEARRRAAEDAPNHSKKQQSDSCREWTTVGNPDVGVDPNAPLSRVATGSWTSWNLQTMETDRVRPTDLRRGAAESNRTD